MHHRSVYVVSDIVQCLIITMNITY